MPCGRPSSGEAVKPRKRSVGWKRLVVIPSRVTAPRRSFSASAIEAAPRAARSPPSITVIAAARRSRSTPTPGSGVTPTTSTCSAIAATGSITSMTLASPAAICTSSRTCVSKPVSVKVTVYVPGSRASMYAPPASVVAVTGGPGVACAVTVAPGAAAPCASVTVPVSDPVCAAAAAGAARQSTVAPRRASRWRGFPEARRRRAAAGTRSGRAAGSEFMPVHSIAPRSVQAE